MSTNFSEGYSGTPMWKITAAREERLAQQAANPVQHGPVHTPIELSFATAALGKKPKQVFIGDLERTAKVLKLPFTPTETPCAYFGVFAGLRDESDGLKEAKAAHTHLLQALGAGGRASLMYAVKQLDEAADVFGAVAVGLGCVMGRTLSVARLGTAVFRPGEAHRHSVAAYAEQLGFSCPPLPLSRPREDLCLPSASLQPQELSLQALQTAPNLFAALALGGLQHDALSKANVRSAFRRAAVVCHPDKLSEEQAEAGREAFERLENAAAKVEGWLDADEEAAQLLGRCLLAPDHKDLDPVETASILQRLDAEEAVVAVRRLVEGIPGGLAPLRAIGALGGRDTNLAKKPVVHEFDVGDGGWVCIVPEPGADVLAPSDVEASLELPPKLAALAIVELARERGVDDAACMLVFAKAGEKAGDEPPAKKRKTIPRVRVKHLLLRVGPNRSAEAAQLSLLQIFRALRQNPGSWSKHCTVSECKRAAKDGDLGWVQPGQWGPGFDAAASVLSVGEVSDLAESPQGFHLLMRTA